MLRIAAKLGSSRSEIAHRVGVSSRTTLVGIKRPVDALNNLPAKTAAAGQVVVDVSTGSHLLPQHKRQVGERLSHVRVIRS